VLDSGHQPLTAPCAPLAADKVFFSIALYMGDGGYQVVRMLIISYRHFMAVRRARKANGKYEDTSENSDALGLGIKLQARAPTAANFGAQPGRLDGLWTCCHVPLVMPTALVAHLQLSTVSMSENSCLWSHQF